jgi:hypothetical protein
MRPDQKLITSFEVKADPWLSIAKSNRDGNSNELDLVS